MQDIKLPNVQTLMQTKYCTFA